MGKGPCYFTGLFSNPVYSAVRKILKTLVDELLPFTEGDAEFEPLIFDGKNSNAISLRSAL